MLATVLTYIFFSQYCSSKVTPGGFEACIHINILKVNKNQPRRNTKKYQQVDERHVFMLISHS